MDVLETYILMVIWMYNVIYEATERICLFSGNEHQGGVQHGLWSLLWASIKALKQMDINLDQNLVDGELEDLSCMVFHVKELWEIANVILDCSPVNTPMDLVEKLKPNIGKPVDQLEYSRAIGCLMYAMKSTRPDIAYVVGYHSVLEGYSDASWINHVEDSSFASGWVFLFEGGAISWASKKQTCVTSSTMEFEFVALAATGNEAEWLRNLIYDILIWPKPIAPISIRCDSAPTMARAYSQIYNGKSRHLGVRHSMMEKAKRMRLTRRRQLEDVPELIHHIQALLPPKDAAHTCVLSKSWLHAWSTIPTLRFCQSSKSLTKQQERRYLRMIRRNIQRYHRDNIPVITCDIHFGIRKPKSATLAEKFIKRVASKISLKELCLRVVDDAASFTLPDETFSSENSNMLNLKIDFSLHTVFPSYFLLAGHSCFTGRLSIFISNLSFQQHIQLNSAVGFIVFGKLPAINGFGIPLPVAVCSGIANSSL
ncbi:zinc finger, CCHC-type containing protein [Tanacetum coccineum]